MVRSIIGYQYKIQWMFNPITALKIIKIIGVRSLDRICLRNISNEIVDTYTGFLSYPEGLAEAETIKYIKKFARKHQDIFFVELLRK
jgi:glycine cleavage system pyridoxal-binding protein P